MAIIFILFNFCLSSCLVLLFLSEMLWKWLPRYFWVSYLLARGVGGGIFVWVCYFGLIWVWFFFGGVWVGQGIVWLGIQLGCWCIWDIPFSRMCIHAWLHVCVWRSAVCVGSGCKYSHSWEKYPQLRSTWAPAYVSEGQMQYKLLRNSKSSGDRMVLYLDT